MHQGESSPEQVATKLYIYLPLWLVVTSFQQKTTATQSVSKENRDTRKKKRPRKFVKKK